MGHVYEGHVYERHIYEGYVYEGHVYERHIYEGHIYEGHVYEGHVYEGHIYEGHIYRVNVKCMFYLFVVNIYYTLRWVCVFESVCLGLLCLNYPVEQLNFTKKQYNMDSSFCMDSMIRLRNV